MDRWSLLVLTGSSVLLLIILGVDCVTTLTLLLFYLGVQVIVGSMIRGYWWLVMALVSTVLWSAVRYVAPGPDAMVGTAHEPLLTAVWNAMVRFGVLVLVGFLCARLRLYSRSPESFSSSHDPTGLLSPSGLNEALSRRHTAERLTQGPVALLLLDVERRVSAYSGQSSEYGALVGAMVSKAVMDHARAADICARLSPNHFLVIMPNTDETAAATLNAAVLNALPEIIRSLNDSVSISSLMLYSAASVPDVGRMRAYAENRLTTLKVLGMGRNHSENWTPPSPPGQQRPVTTG